MNCKNIRHHPQWTSLSPEDQLILATRIAAELGYILVQQQPTWSEERTDVLMRLERLEALTNPRNKE